MVVVVVAGNGERGRGGEENVTVHGQRHGRKGENVVVYNERGEE